MKKTAIAIGLLLFAAPLFTACETKEDRAAQTALDYVQARMEGDTEKAWKLISKEDRETKNKKMFMAAGKMMQGFLKKIRDKTTFRVESTAIDGDTATVKIVSEGPNAKKAMQQKAESLDDVPYVTEERTVSLVREPADSDSNGASGKKVWRVDTD